MCFTPGTLIAALFWCWDCDCVNIECYSEESDDEDEADTAEMCAEYMDQLTPGSLHVSNHTLYANLNRPITVSI